MIKNLFILCAMLGFLYLLESNDFNKKCEDEEKKEIKEHNKIENPAPFSHVNMQQCLDSDNSCILKPFFDKLIKLEKNKNNKIRIFYYGNSMLEADFITKTVRREFQKKFGGYGKGFMLLSKPYKDAAFGYNLNSNNISTESLFKGNFNTEKRYGFNGAFSLATNKNASVKYTIKDSINMLNPKLYYGKSNNMDAIITIKESSNSLKLSPTKNLNEHLLAVGRFEQLNFNFKNAQQIPFYAVDFSGTNGVYVDNFGLRGTNGLSLRFMQKDIMNELTEKPSLVILHYGLNLATLPSSTFANYPGLMKIVIDNMKFAYPNAPICILSSTDYILGDGRKKREAKTIVEQQQKFAQENGLCFINAVDIMGGEGSIKTWANKGLAEKPTDGHFTKKGYEAFGMEIYKYIIRMYYRYKYKQYKQSLKEK